MRRTLTWSTVLLAGAALLASCAVDPSGLGGPVAADSGPDDGGDLCPDDPDKTSPGTCGCGSPDDDSDGDGFFDCLDGCPSDPAKEDPGACGCGFADVDSDDDGAFVCDDCDDSDPQRGPSSTEVCDGVDQDCDELVDEGLSCANGCADGTREGFVDIARYPRIAGCSGAWSIAGAFGDGEPSCDRQAGNDGAIVDGSGCDVDDLCEPGWTVCSSTSAVSDRAVDGCEQAVPDGAGPTFFLAAISGDDGECNATGVDGVFGCGNAGTEDLGLSCAPLNRTLERPCELLTGVVAWRCEGHIRAEASVVVKTESEYGGVLCCAP